MTAWSAGDRAIYHNAGRTDDPMEGEVILNGPHPLAEGRGWYIRNAQGSAGFAFLDELTPVTTPAVDLGIADTRALDAIAAVASSNLAATKPRNALAEIRAILQRAGRIS